MSFDYEKAQEDEIDDLRVKLAEAERDLQYEQREREFTKQQHDAALARVKELELEIADYKGCDSPETHDHLHRMYLASEARITELEGALRELFDVSPENWRMWPSTSVDRARRVLKETK